MKENNKSEMLYVDVNMKGAYVSLGKEADSYYIGPFKQYSDAG